MRYFYGLFICFILYCQLALAEFNPIRITYVSNSDLSNLSYLTIDNYLCVPRDNPPALYTIPDSLKQSLRPIEYTKIDLNDINYDITVEQFMVYHRTHSGYVKPSPNLQKERQREFDHANQILTLFVNKYPDLRLKLESAAAYGVFEIVSFNTVIYAGGFGSGIIFDNVEKSTRYVDTFRAGTGLGLGYISNYTLIVFYKHFALEQYFGAGGAGGDVGGSGTAGIWNRSVSFNPTISTYHIFHYGANIQLNWGGTLYWLSPTLN